MDRDGAPPAEEAHPRCDVQSKVTLPGTFELGRVSTSTSRVFIGARRAGRTGVLDTDGLTARFTEVADAVGDVPPAIPVVDGERVLTVEYEGTPRHLVVRDVASPAKPIAELPREPPDESLAYDAVIVQGGVQAGGIVVAWDAPADEGSAVYASVVQGNVVGEPVRLSPKDVDADTPRVVAMGPTLVAAWLAHRPIAKPDASTTQAQPLEAPGQDLDHTWVEVLAFGQDSSLHPISPLRHLTPDGGRVTTFDLKAALTPPSVTVVARDALELQAGQGGTALLVRVHGLDVDPPIVLAEHVGRGLPLVTSGVLYDDPSGRGHMVASGQTSPEPSLDGARPLAVLQGQNVLVAPEGASELRVVRCIPQPALP
jgi:hypothetical protein